MSDMHDALSVAYYVIRYYNDMDRDINNIIVNSVLYFLQAEFLVDTGSPLFPEPIEAWSCGVRVPSVEAEFRHLGNGHISSSFLKDSDYYFSEKETMLMNKIILTCMAYTASELSRLVYSQKPWLTARKSLEPRVEVTKESIRDFFMEPDMSYKPIRRLK